MKGNSKHLNTIAAKNWSGDVGEAEMLFDVYGEASCARDPWAVTRYIPRNPWSPGGGEEGLLQEKNVNVVRTGGLYDGGDAVPQSVDVPVADVEAIGRDRDCCSGGVLA